MTELLFLSLAKRARQVILWTMIVLSGIGASGIWTFLKRMPEGFSQASEAAIVRQGLNLLYLSAFLFLCGAMYHFWVSRRYRQNMRLSEPDGLDGDDLSDFVRLPSGTDLNIHAESEEILRVLKLEDYSNNIGFWKDLRQMYCRAPFKSSKEHNRIRTFLLGKTR